jgi:transposase
VDLPADEHHAVAALLRQLDFHGDELAMIDRELAVEALADPIVRRVMTIPGVDVTVALSVLAAVGEFEGFPSAEKLVAYLGLHPKIRQSGGLPANHGRITKAGNAHARGMLVEAAWVASRARDRCVRSMNESRRGARFQVAVVATARKLAVLCWHLVTKDRTTRSPAPVWSRSSAASSNSPPVRQPPAPAAVLDTSTTTNSCAATNARSSSKPNTPTPP